MASMRCPVCKNIDLNPKPTMGGNLTYSDHPAKKSVPDVLCENSGQKHVGIAALSKYLMGLNK